MECDVVLTDDDIADALTATVNDSIEQVAMDYDFVPVREQDPFEMVDDDSPDTSDYEVVPLKEKPLMLSMSLQDGGFICLL